VASFPAIFILRILLTEFMFYLVAQKIALVVIRLCVKLTNPLKQAAQIRWHC